MHYPHTHERSYRSIHPLWGHKPLLTGYEPRHQGIPRLSQLVAQVSRAVRGVGARLGGRWMCPKGQVQSGAEPGGRGIFQVRHRLRKQHHSFPLASTIPVMERSSTARSRRSCAAGWRWGRGESQAGRQGHPSMPSIAAAGPAPQRFRSTASSASHDHSNPHHPLTPCHGHPMGAPDHNRPARPT